MQFKEINSILIIGAGGNLAELLMEKIHADYPQIKLVGVDSRKKKNLISMEYTRGNFEKVFREDAFDCVFLLGRFAHMGLSPLKSLAKELGSSISGIKSLFDQCLKFKVKKIIVLSSFHVYGALAENPIFLNEETPLKADLCHPDVRDLVEMDKIAQIWRSSHPEVETIILRPCNLIGPRIQNAITKFLRLKKGPIPIDYNPNFQFFNEMDFIEILMKAVTHLPPGTYNVAPDDYIPLREAKVLTGAGSVPIPICFFIPTAKILGKTLWSLPDYLLGFFQYPCIIDNSKLKANLPDFKPIYSTKSSLSNLG